jgi:hypothetical protein
MNNLVYLATFFLTLYLVNFKTCAYELAIYTDQESKSKAQEVIQTFKQTYPFNSLEISYKIIPTTTEQLNCQQNAQITRVLSCNSSHVRTDSASQGYDQALIVRDVQEYGGSGGSIPVISAGSDPRMMLHEYLHTLGLCDEYAYSSAEAEIYCKETLKRPNLTVIKPKADGYSSDQEARSEHGSEIPWFSQILATTKITNQNKLGTKRETSISAPLNSGNSTTSFSTPTGLYKAKTCNAKTPPIQAWHPGGEKTIMENLSLGLGANNERIVREILISRGATPIISSTRSNTAHINNNERKAKETKPESISSSSSRGSSAKRDK